MMPHVEQERHPTLPVNTVSTLVFDGFRVAHLQFSVFLHTDSCLSLFWSRVCLSILIFYFVYHVLVSLKENLQF